MVRQLTAGLILLAAVCSAQQSADEKMARQMYGPPVSASEIFQASSPSVATVFCNVSGGSIVSGTAWVVTPTKVVTCLHVVRAATKIDVAFGGDPLTGDVHVGAMVLAVSEDADLALLELDRKVSRAPLRLDSYLFGFRDVEGCPVYVIGSPEGLELTLSSGIVSATRFEDRPAVRFPRIEYLQISAAVSHGSSGSPVFSDRGEVIGVIQSKVASGESLNFAVQSSEVLTAFENLIRDELDTLAIERERSRVGAHFFALGHNPAGSYELRRVQWMSCQIYFRPNYKSKQVGLLLEGDVAAVVSSLGKHKSVVPASNEKGARLITVEREWVRVFMPNGQFGYADAASMPQLKRRLVFAG